MPTTIEVKTQRIVVNPPSGKIDIIGYGPQGPAGPAGPPGSGVVVAWPVVAPPLPEGQVHFTPSNANLAGLRPSTDANSWIRFWAGPPTAIYIKANSGPLTSGRMGEIYLDSDVLFVRSSDGTVGVASFGKTAISMYLPTTITAALSVTGTTSVAALNSSVGITAPSITTTGSSVLGSGAGSIIYLGNGADARVFIGNDAELYDAGAAHTIGLRSQTDSNQGELKFGGGVRVKGMPTYFQIIAPPAGNGYLDAGTLYFRAVDGTQFGGVDGNGVFVNGGRYFRFADYGGGWYMNETVWMRALNDKSVWIGGGFFGSDGGITIGRGGTTDTTWRAYFQCNVFSTSQVSSYQYEARTASAGDWGGIHPYRANPGGTAADITLHPGGVAAQIKMYQNTNQVENRDAGGGAWVGSIASYFTVASSLRLKSDVIDLPIPRPLDVARVLQPIWFRAPNDIVEPIPIYSDDVEPLLLGSDYTTHVCGESPYCDGTQENPCPRIQRYNRGRVSLSAEQVEQVFPTIAQYDHEGRLMGYDVVGLVSLLVGAIRNLADDVDYLKGLVA